jgi:CubicO group peptidase (beta-lactamase class C family)
MGFEKGGCVMGIERSVTLGNWMEPPFNRAAFQRVRELAPTALIRNRSGRTLTLPRHPIELDSLVVERFDGTKVNFSEHLDASYCDAICVVHDGAIVFERYLNGMTETTPHLIMSVSKSITAGALGVSIGRGLLATGDLVCDVAPEFTGTSLDGATVQHVIDMATGTDFVEDYDLYGDPDGDTPLIEYERQASYRPLGARTPIGTLGHFRTYAKAYEHGARFDYRSPLTNIAARMLEVVNGERFPDIVSRDLWGPLGQEHDADIMLDPLGHPVAEGGISCTVRDLARFGMAYLDDGVVDGREVLPAAWVTDTFHGSDEGGTRFRTGDYHELGWDDYRNAFWVFDRDQVASGLGIFGQYCFVHRPSRTVISRMSTYPSAVPEELSAETVRAFTTVCEALT